LEEDNVTLAELNQFYNVGPKLNLILVRMKRQNLPAALGPGVYSASNRNDYQKHKNNNVTGE
jgi:hypothetical protein